MLWQKLYKPMYRHNYKWGDKMQNTNKNDNTAEELFKKLSPEDQKRVKTLLADKSACEKLLNSPEAKKIIRQFTGGK